MARDAHDRLGAPVGICALTKATPSASDHIAGVALGSVWLFGILDTVVGIAAAGYVAATGLAIYTLTQLGRLAVMGWLVLLAAGAASVASWLHVAEPVALLTKALSVGCFFISVLLSGGFLRDAADRSSMILNAGTALIRQPPARRNAALSFGAFAMGFVLSFGTLQLLGAMVAKANTLESANGNSAVQATRLRRSMLAVLRGFCMSTVCNPISIVMALALTYAPGAQWLQLLVIVVPSAIILLLIGAVLDWVQGPRVPPAGTRAPSLWPVAAVVGLVVAVVTAVLVVARLADIPIIRSVLVTVPSFAFAWMLLQQRGSIGAVLARVEWQAVTRYPTQRVEVIILGSAGIAATFMAEALPVEHIASLVQSWHLPSVVLPLVVFWFVFVGANLAMNPILTVSIAGAVLPAPLLLGASPLSVAVAYMLGWGIATCSSPFTLSTLIISGIAGRRSTEVAWRWNSLFALSAGILASAWLGWLSAQPVSWPAFDRSVEFGLAGEDMLVFVGRLLATAALVITVARIAERAGPFFASTILTLPLFAGPAYFFLMYEVPAEFLATSALVAFAGTGAVLAFTAGFIQACRRVGLVLSLFAGAASWVVLAAPVQWVEASLSAGVAFCAAGALIAYLLRRPFDLHERPRAGPARWPSLVFRSLVAGVAVALVSAVATLLGPMVTGLLVTFPLTLSVSVWMAYTQYGSEFAAAMLAATQRTLPTFATFCVVFSQTVAVLPVPWGFWVALLASALCASGLALFAARTAGAR
ncbi:MAG: hypothetical protein AAF458_08915 [Pseudomonadota bacterium]